MNSDKDYENNSSNGTTYITQNERIKEYIDSTFGSACSENESKEGRFVFQIDNNKFTFEKSVIHAAMLFEKLSSRASERGKAFNVMFNSSIKSLGDYFTILTPYLQNEVTEGIKLAIDIVKEYIEEFDEYDFVYAFEYDSDEDPVDCIINDMDQLLDTLDTVIRDLQRREYSDMSEELKKNLFPPIYDRVPLSDLCYAILDSIETGDMFLAGDSMGELQMLADEYSNDEELSKYYDDHTRNVVMIKNYINVKDFYRSYMFRKILSFLKDNDVDNWDGYEETFEDYEQETYYEALNRNPFDLDNYKGFYEGLKTYDDKKALIDMAMFFGICKDDLYYISNNSKEIWE